jgi:hypothetical protein
VRNNQGRGARSRATRQAPRLPAREREHAAFPVPAVPRAFPPSDVRVGVGVGDWEVSYNWSARGRGGRLIRQRTQPGPGAIASRRRSAAASPGVPLRLRRRGRTPRGARHHGKVLVVVLRVFLSLSLSRHLHR